MHSITKFASTTPGKKKNTSRRENTLSWQIGRVNVCKTFFLTTLGYKPTNDRIARSVLGPKCLQSDNIIVPVDGRGRHVPINKFPDVLRKQVVKHIESYNPCVTHYRLEHAPNRRYLPSNLTVKEMHSSFISTQADDPTQRLMTCSYQYYYDIFKSMGISFSVPTQDLCTLCAEHESSHASTEQHSCKDCMCIICRGFEQHKLNASEARIAMVQDVAAAVTSNNSHIVTTADMQKVILMPEMDIKDYFFSRKLVLFNETFAPPAGIVTPPKCVIWHEGECGRKAFNIANSYIAYLQNESKFTSAVKATIFVDNCNSQNKNWTLYSALVRFVNDNETNFTSVDIKYFEPGHTYMAADSVHGSIGKALRRQANIYDFQDYLELITASRGSMEAIVLDHSKQIVFESESKQRIPGVLLRNIRVVQFRRGSFSLYFKECHSDDTFKVADFLKRDIKRALEKHGPEGLLEFGLKKESSPRGISAAKKRDLLKLCRCMPAEKKKFFHDLTVNDEAVDLDTNID